MRCSFLINENVFNYADSKYGVLNNSCLKPLSLYVFCLYKEQEAYMKKETKKQGIILNSELKDSSSKIIFDDRDWCAQFLNDYVPIFHFGKIKLGDIEDVSEQFVPFFENKRNEDSVKKINIQGRDLFYLLSIIEHKTQVDYNVSMICTAKKNFWRRETRYRWSC